MPNMPNNVLHSGDACVISAAGGDAVGCGCSSGVEHNLAKVGVEGSNPFARSKFPQGSQALRTALRGRFLLPRPGLRNRGSMGEAAGSRLWWAHGRLWHG